jgi:hypothetical protein
MDAEVCFRFWGAGMTSDTAAVSLLVCLRFLDLTGATGGVSLSELTMEEESDTSAAAAAASSAVP